MKQCIFLTAFLFALVACTESTPPAVMDVGHNKTGTPALHEVHDKRLHDLMARMNSVMQERFLTEPELDAEWRRNAPKIAKTAHELSHALDDVLETSKTLKLTKEEKVIFRALAHKLRNQAQELETNASQNRTAGIYSSLEQIKSTCTSCHSLFRKL